MAFSQLAKEEHGEEGCLKPQEGFSPESVGSQHLLLSYRPAVGSSTAFKDFSILGLYEVSICRAFVAVEFRLTHNC